MGGRGMKHRICCPSGTRTLLERSVREKLRESLCNATRYSPAGTTICVSVATSSRSQVEVVVTDQEPGVAAAEQERVFELPVPALCRLAAPLTPASNLSICRAPAQRHGGDVTGQRARQEENVGPPAAAGVRVAGAPVTGAEPAGATVSPVPDVVRPACPALRPFVTSLGCVGGILTTGRESVMPTATVRLMLNLHEDEFRTYAAPEALAPVRTCGAVLAGPRSRHIVIDTEEQRSLVEVTFELGGALLFFGVPMSAVRDQLVE